MFLDESFETVILPDKKDAVILQFYCLNRRTEIISPVPHLNQNVSVRTFLYLFKDGRLAHVESALLTAKLAPIIQVARLVKVQLPLLERQVMCEYIVRFEEFRHIIIL